MAVADPDLAHRRAVQVDRQISAVAGGGLGPGGGRAAVSQRGDVGAVGVSDAGNVYLIGRAAAAYQRRSAGAGAQAQEQDNQKGDQTTLLHEDQHPFCICQPGGPALIMSFHPYNDA